MSVSDRSAPPGAAWLPPDQAPTLKFPVVGERAPTPDALDPERWSLQVSGLVARPRRWRWAEVAAWPSETLITDVHCVTRWSRRAVRFAGRPLAALLAEVEPGPTARFVRFVAHSERDHDTSLPLDVALADAWLVTHADDAALTPEHGGPLRVVTVGRYFYKSLKWLRCIELLSDDAPGYWERADGYHPVGDPWPGDQRYVSGSLTPKEVEAFRVRTDFSRWRGRTVRRADLSGWRPATRTLRGLSLKGCDLRGADLSGADLREANLSLSDLRGADLSGADLRGADLEGTWLEGAILRGADLRGAALTAADLSGPSGEPPTDRLAGARWEGATGLLEDQRQWLATRPPD